ncbi:metalloendopeptidase [Coemansia nantahalensis]|nr:metalloendopeptidase [Coemansia nantahalensis]
MTTTTAAATARKGSVVDFCRTPAEISRNIEQLISKSRAAQDAIGQETAPTFTKTIVPLDRTSVTHDVEARVAHLLGSVAVEKEVRDAGNDAYKLLSEFAIECSTREDVYKAVRAVFDNEEEMAGLSPEDRHLVERVERGYRRQGLQLPPEKREQLNAVRKRISGLEIAFKRCVNEEDARVLFTREELEGLPEDYFDGRETEEDNGVSKYVVTSKYPDYLPLMKYATREATRKTMGVAAASRCPDNIPRLQELVSLRLEMATLLGYSTYSEYAMEILMAKRPADAIAMETNLLARLAEPARKEADELAALKRSDAELAGEEYEGFYIWDSAYYSRIVSEQKHDIRGEEVKQYFPLDKATRGMLDIYQKMLGLRIAQVDNPPVWHPDVAMYEVWEADEDTFVGHFYLDLHPREGKYNHAAVFPIRYGCDLPDGSREYPVAAMVANFPRATSAAPALLPHSDITTLMHELGHVFHSMCAHTKWNRFHGFQVEWDFVEAPSQMLENWAWESASLRQFAVHHSTGEPMPDEMIAKLVAAKNEGAAGDCVFQVFLGMYDLAIHNTTSGDIDVDKMFNDMRDQITNLGTGSVETHRVATFSHTAVGYASKYYGYLWSEVYSMDMYASRFKSDGVDNAATGMDYRREILRPGGSRDAMESLVRFLGRKPNNRAFLESIGLQAD